MAVIVYLLLFKTTWGFELRMVGSNPNAARYAGVKITKTTVVAMVLSSALAGMAGANEVLGINYRLFPAFSSGYGFDSIALALLGKTHPLGVILSSLLFGFLRNGARSMQLCSWSTNRYCLDPPGFNPGIYCCSCNHKDDLSFERIQAQRRIWSL